VLDRRQGYGLGRGQEVVAGGVHAGLRFAILSAGLLTVSVD
jgi:hypothetical protein